MVNKYLDLVDFSHKYILYTVQESYGIWYKLFKKKTRNVRRQKNPALSDRSRYVRILCATEKWLRQDQPVSCRYPSDPITFEEW